ncbi:Bromo adjacent homology (BAH) domain [Heracleum sosnowskyi]|uniref:Bromo adjacent homology (BAH) domain n=1 Tax=Heracleum sosnowskyi TaxID=360622 RepID=A0AAD8H6S4_9APIA|nr:Bromo adjacent homology (BAH) domain [Heracleum sosnowskyi]
MTTQLIDSIGVVDATGGFVRSEGSKRVSENGEFEVRSVKKAKSGGEVGDGIRKVAEIVLVLATMGKIRGGEVPSVVETEMMENARAKLVEVSDKFAPKDVFPTHAFGSIIEDLALDSSRARKLGFQPPKISIAQKVNLTNQKMENSEKYAPQSPKFMAQTAESNICSSVESHSGVRTVSAEKPSPVPSPLGFQPSGPVSTAISTSLPYQLPTSEVRPLVSTGLPSSDIGTHTSALVFPRAERSYFSLNGKSSGISYTSQVQANSSGDNTKTPTWTVQSQVSSSAKTVSDNNASFHASVKGGAPGMSKTTSQANVTRPFITQTTSVNPLGVHQHIQQGIRFVQSPSPGNSHNEIGKIVLKLLQQQVLKYPVWTPPSRDYMNKALPCQICKLVIREVDNVLVCDACEKGYHLNCIQMLNPKSLPKAEWQCGKCFSLGGGKPLPPKYGRVTRNSTMLKVSPHATAIHLSVDKNVGIIDVKDKLERTTTNGNSGIQSAPKGALDNSNHSAKVGDRRIMQGSGSTSAEAKYAEEHSSRYSSNNLIKTPGVPICTSNHFATDIDMEDVKVMQRNCSFSSNGIKDEYHPSEPVANNLVVTLGASSVTHDDLKVERLIEEKLDPKCNSQPSAKSVTVGKTFDDSQTSRHNKNDQTELTNKSKIPSKQCPETNIMVSELGKSRGEDFMEHKMRDANKDNNGVSGYHVEPAGTCIGPEELSESLPDSLHDVDWIGDIIEVVDEKTYYQSCSMSGVLYKVQDHALFRSNNNILTPFKLQSMWEDRKTRSKWVVASRCYFPADLPEAVGRPCSPEINEVYESNHDTILSAGSIEGPCEVLPPRTFIEETERRTHLASPLYICKWFFDEKKGLFRAVTN